ncbi:MAG: putative membrane protein YczE [Acidimicrobiales bacterium]|jgi:uncharacterized membrane protein YczE
MSSPLQKRLVVVAKTIGMSRHTALPALRRVASSSAASFTRRLVSRVLGASLIGIAVALFVNGNLGLPPYDVMSSALSQRLGITLGQSGWAMAAVLFVIAAVLGHRPSAWGLGYIFAIGLAIDAASGLLTEPDTMAGRWLFVIAAVVLLTGGIILGGSFGPAAVRSRSAQMRRRATTTST